MEELTLKERSALSTLFFDGKSRTQQQFVEECNINTIVKRFGLTGTVPVPRKLPTYGDFSGVIDYQTALNSVLQAEESFSSVPSEIRRRFDNDPQKFLDFVVNPDNMDELRKLGLASPAPDVSIPKESMQQGSEPGAGGASSTGST